MSGHEIIVVPFPHPGHIFPAIELSRQLADRNHHVTLLLPSTSSPSSLHLHPLIHTLEFTLPHPTSFPPGLLEETLPRLLTQHLRTTTTTTTVIVDEMISWMLEICHHLNIPSVAFFTSSAYTESVDHSEPPPGHHRGGGHPPRHHRRRPRGLAGTTEAVALLVNTCDEIERPFLDRMAVLAGKPVWGVGPLLPAQFWTGPAASGPIRPGRGSSVSEGEVLAWLDAHTPGSVVYVAFGTLVSPADVELAELAAGLAQSGRPFIWVVQPETFRHGPAGEPIGPSSGTQEGFSAAELARRAGKKGLVITGWAPQLMILGHVATGAYVCHCGWNSTVEALASGVPLLTWPVRGDQFHNAELVVGPLGAGCHVRGAQGEAVTRADVVVGIERVLTDVNIKRSAAATREIFASGFPKSSSASLDAFVDYIAPTDVKN